jgi:hypothetical protein
MKISELIKNLEKAKEEVGDLQVFGYDYIWNIETNKVSVVLDDSSKLEERRLSLTFESLMDEEFHLAI